MTKKIAFIGKSPEKRKSKIDFNNGFITAIALFLEHKDCWQIVIDKNNKIISDLRLYGATDHLYDLEIPLNLNPKIYKRIFSWRKKCFEYRLDSRIDKEKFSKLTDELFEEAENILKSIDEKIFKVKKVKMNYR